MRIRGDGLELEVLDEGAGRPAGPARPRLPRLLAPLAPSGRSAHRRRPARDRARTCAASASRTSRRRSTPTGSRTPSPTSSRSSMRSAIERAKVVGHDWGAGVAWIFAALHPDRVERLVAMSVGHPGAQRRTYRRPREGVVHAALPVRGRRRGAARARRLGLFREWLREDGDVERYVDDLSRPGALTAGLSWYRANLHPKRQLEPRPALPPVRRRRSASGAPATTTSTSSRCSTRPSTSRGPWRYERVEGASHWMQLDAHRPRQRAAARVPDG